MEGFGDRLRQAIANTGKSRRSFAIEIGIDDGLLSSYVHEKSYPNSYMAVRLAKALGVSLDWLLMGEKNEKED
jgi:transcriptional regulator with XRE-family HTH domain